MTGLKTVFRTGGLVLALGVLGACETLPSANAYGPPSTTAFNVEAFGWSTRSGQASINGTIAYQQDGRAFDCIGSVGLTPDTPYTRARFNTLYGSVSRAAVPVAVVRARSVPDPNADYRSFVRDVTCADRRFNFTGLPDGGWFIIAPVSDGGEPIVLMRRVETRGGRMISVTM